MIEKHFKKIILLILACLFIAPSLAAYFLYGHTDWLSKVTTNRGVLQKPPILMPELKTKRPWHMVLFAKALSEQDELVAINTMVQIRLALGRLLYDVDLIVIDSSERMLQSKAINQLIKEQQIIHLHPSIAALHQLQTRYASSRLFIADPRQYLVLAYPTPISAKDVYHDVKLLLNTTPMPRNSPAATSLISIHPSEKTQ